MSPTTGDSLRNDIYTKDIIDETYTELQGFNIYKKFELFMDSVVSDDTVQEWEAFPYDWRLDFDKLLTSGKVIGRSDGKNEISYLEATSTPYILQELARLVEESDTGKVTFITHSNGGLFVKYLTSALINTEHPLYADPAIAQYRSIIDSIDSIIMVAAPQIGTPKAMEALLHGDETEMVRSWGFLMDEEQVRELGENMLSAYNLLPSKKYFDIVQTPVIAFDSDVTEVYDFLSLYGDSIDTAAEFEAFLLGDNGLRSEPSSGDQDSPNVLKEAFLQKSAETHDSILDDWQAPDHIELIQVAGWGISTISGIVYDDCDIWFCPDQLSNLDRQVKMTHDGDGTVVLPSAIAMGTDDVETWYVNMRDYNRRGIFNETRNRDHSNILEIDSLQNFIGGTLKHNVQASEFVIKEEPKHEEDDIQLNFRLHSPVELHIYDEDGGHTGLMPSSAQYPNVRFYEAELPNSYYQEIGETKYAGADASKPITLSLKGEDTGTFTLEIEEARGDEVLDYLVFSDIPVTAQTTGSIVLQSLGDVSKLELDIDGDGLIDVEYEPESGLSEEDVIALLREEIQSLDISDKKKARLLKKLDKLERILDKEFKKDKKKKQRTKAVSKKLIQKIRIFKKKGFLTKDESKDLIEMVREVKVGMLK